MNLCCTKKFYVFIFSAESEQGIGDWSTGYNSYTDCSDINSVQVCYLFVDFLY